MIILFYVCSSQAPETNCLMFRVTAGPATSLGGNSQRHEVARQPESTYRGPQLQHTHTQHCAPYWHLYYLSDRYTITPVLLLNLLPFFLLLSLFTIFAYISALFQFSPILSHITAFLVSFRHHFSPLSPTFVTFCMFFFTTFKKRVYVS